MKIYNIISRVDLSIYFIEGKSALYNRIKSLHKPYFEDNERIVFYFESNDYEQVNEVKSFLNNSLQEIDIPSFFVITEFSEVLTHKKYDDTKCVLPWLSVYVSPKNGYLQPCCIAEPENDSIEEYQTINEAINCSLLKNTRLAMINNTRPNTCKKCYDLEDKNLISSRMISNQSWKNVSFTTYDDGSIDLNLRFYDIRLNNLCNFKCRTCSSEFSSSIASEEQELFNIKNTSVKVANRKAYNKFYQSVIDNLNNVEEFYFAGGEPIIMIEHYQILDELLKAKKYNVILSYNTNFSQLQFKDKNVINYWKQFNDVRVSMSLDAMDKQAEYLRKGTIWKNILSNIQRVKDSCPHVNLKISSTWSIYNSFHLIDFQKFLIENSIIPINCISFEAAFGNYNDVRLLSKSLKIELKEKILDHIKYLKSKNADALINKWDNAQMLLESQDNNFFINQFIKHVTVLDKARNESFFEIFPELVTLRNND